MQNFEQMGGSLPSIFNLKDETYSKCSPEELKERIVAVIMVDQSCDERFADFKKDRNEDAHLGRDDFPATEPERLSLWTTIATLSLNQNLQVVRPSLSMS